MGGNGAKLAFILGNYKSGSTWLLTLLSLHPWIRGVRETQIFTHLEGADDFPARAEKIFSGVPWASGGVGQLPKHKLLTLARPIVKHWRPAMARHPHDRPMSLLDLGYFSQRSLRGKLERADSPEGFCRDFFDHLVGAVRPKGYLLEKSTGAADHVGFIRSCFPEAKLIIIYRDGRDVVTSSRFFEKHHLKKDWSLKDAALAWRKEIEAQQRHAAEFTIHTCSYEGLLQDGKRVVPELLGSLGLPADEALVDDLIHRSSFKALTGRKRGEESRGRFLRKGVSGDWKNHFSDEDKAVFKEVAGDLLIELGYEQDMDW